MLPHVKPLNMQHSLDAVQHSPITRFVVYKAVDVHSAFIDDPPPPSPSSIQAVASSSVAFSDSLSDISDSVSSVPDNDSSYDMSQHHTVFLLVSLAGGASSLVICIITNDERPPSARDTVMHDSSPGGRLCGVGSYHRSCHYVAGGNQSLRWPEP